MTTLDKIVDIIRGDYVYIQTHNFPDPDAIASAFGLQKLLKARGVEAIICYRGKIDRSNLMQMVERLHIEMVNIDDISDMDKTDEVILVDSQKGNSNIIDIPGQEIICIDHHPTYEKAEYLFSDIRPEVGACASIIAGYYVEEGIKMSEDVATALLFGIKIDTANLSRGVSRFDLDMFYYVYALAKTELMNLFELNELQFSDLHAYAHAINTIQVYDRISFANTGYNCPEALVANISDFMLALAEVDFSVVYTLKQDGIKISVRNSIPGLDAGKITNQALKGIGNGGGHASMAGGFVSFDENKMDDEILIASIQERFLQVLHIC